MKLFQLLLLTLAFVCCVSPSFAASGKIDTGAFYIPQNAPSGTADLIEKAAKLALKAPHCMEVVGGAWSTKREARTEAPFDPNKQFYIQCQSDQPGPVPGVPAVFNLYYSYNDLKSNAVVERLRPITDALAISECKKAILERLNFPSSTDIWLVRYGANGTDNNMVVYNFTTLNSIGNRIPQKGSCIITPKNNIEVTITNR